MNYTVCITGANKGIGLEFTKQYAESGWKVLACSRHPDSTNLQSLKELYSNLSVFELDVCDQLQIERLAANLQNIPIDLLINSAGIYGPDKQTFEEVSSEDMQKVFITNSIAPLMVSRALLNNIISSKLKTIVTITSRMGSISDNTSGNLYAYRAAKAAVNMIMKSLSIDIQSKKIKVILLHPGWVKTDMGGLEAPLEVEQSVKGMRQVIYEKLEQPVPYNENLFVNYRHESIPW